MFFNNACRHDFLVRSQSTALTTRVNTSKEAKQGRIQLDEGKETVEVILKSLYGVPIESLEECNTTFEVLDDAEKTRELNVLVDVYVASSKV